MRKKLYEVQIRIVDLQSSLQKWVSHVWMIHLQDETYKYINNCHRPLAMCETDRPIADRQVWSRRRTTAKAGGLREGAVATGCVLPVRCCPCTQPCTHATQPWWQLCRFCCCQQFCVNSFVSIVWLTCSVVFQGWRTKWKTWAARSSPRVWTWFCRSLSPQGGQSTQRGLPAWKSISPPTRSSEWIWVSCSMLWSTYVCARVYHVVYAVRLISISLCTRSRTRICNGHVGVNLVLIVSVLRRTGAKRPCC